MYSFLGGFNSIRLSATQYGPNLGNPHVDSLKGTDKVKNEALGDSLLMLSCLMAVTAASMCRAPLGLK